MSKSPANSPFSPLGSDPASNLGSGSSSGVVSRRLRTLIAIAPAFLVSSAIGASHWTADAPEVAASEASAAVSSLQLSGEFSNGRLLLDLVDPEEGEGASVEELQNLVDELGASAQWASGEMQAEHLVTVTGTPDQLAQLAARLSEDSRIEGIEPEYLYSLPEMSDTTPPLIDPPHQVDPSRGPRVTPNDPMFALQWHLDQIHAPEAWVQGNGKGAVVAVIDTGVAWEDLDWKDIHAKAVPDLAGVPIVHPKTFVPRALPDGLDDHAHGTHVAGTIAQATNNGIGVAGVAHGASIMPLKVLAGSGRGSTSDIANAVRFAADKGAHVINMSLGGPMNSRILAKAVQYAHDKGTTVVCAAGNSGRGRIDFPGANDGCFAVGSLTFGGERAFYSNWGDKLDIVAPGGDTRQDRNGDGFPDGVLQNTIKIQTPSANDYLWFMGTSMAAPHVAGVAALIAGEGVTRPAEVERILQETAVHPNGVKWDTDFGAGRVDAQAAITAAQHAYDGERAALSGALGLLASLGLGGSFLAYMRRRKSQALLATGAGILATAVAAVGWQQPLAYVVAGFSGLAGASLIGFSAIVPVLATMLGLHRPKLRLALAGLALGWAAVLAHGALVLPTVLTELPGGQGWDRAFLAVQAGLCLLLARRVAMVALRSEPVATDTQS